ncbi:lipase family protein [Promicromonospora sp. Marseille-Q5078]
MSEPPSLLFLHGVGSGDREGEWRTALEKALRDLGYPGLDDLSVVAPKYAHALAGVDDDEPLPPLTVKAPTGETARQNRRDFERREHAVEVMLGRHDAGTARLGSDAIASTSLRFPMFRQAENYLAKRRIRAHVLKLVLKEVPRSGRIVVVGHSLGSVIAADVVRRLPADVQVVGMVTIGSPLSSTSFHADGVRDALKEPPTNLGWWVSFWHPADPVTTHRGVSSVFPWMTDYRVRGKVDHHVHDAVAYLSDPTVARAVGYALHGSMSKELTAAARGVDVPIDEAETMVLLALRFAHLVESKLEGARRARYVEARRQVQATAVDSMIARREHEGRPLPSLVSELAVDLSDPDTAAAEPERISHLSKELAVLPLIGVMSTNVVQPFEIEIPSKVRIEALEDLAIEMGLGRQFARDLAAAGATARKTLSSDGTNWIKWAAITVGAAAIVVATGGLALAAAPGVAGAAAITSALAAFGPGGMIGGLLTAGALVGAGGGGVAVGLASPTTTAEAVEAFVTTKITAAILRKKQGFDQDPTTWESLAATGIELRREQAHLETVSDEDAPSLKAIKRKLKAIDRALTYLSSVGLGPDVPREQRSTKSPSAGAVGTIGATLRRRRPADASPGDTPDDEVERTTAS